MDNGSESNHVEMVGVVIAVGAANGEDVIEPKQRDGTRVMMTGRQWPESGPASLVTDCM